MHAEHPNSPPVIERFQMHENCETLNELLDSSFALHADAFAVEVGKRKINFRQFDQWSRQLAASISELANEQLQAKPVAIVMPRSVELYLAMAAVVRAGGFFVPIDPELPANRIRLLLDDSCCQLVLVQKQNPPDFEIDQKTLQVEADQLDADELREQPALHEPEEPKYRQQVSENDLAYLVYTSGSTGKPKGVAISHRSIVNHNRWCIKAYGKRSADRCLQFTSPGFDVCVEEVFTALVAGACLVTIAPETMSTPSRFLKWVDEKEITQLTLPASFWEVLTLAYHSSWSQSLRLIVIGGDRVNAQLVDSWFDRIGDRIELCNAYGPTEATITASHAKLRPGCVISIGRPVDGFEFSVVDQSQQPVATGEVGELVIAGIGVARGYWRRPQLSTQRFNFTNSPDESSFRTGDLVRQLANGEYEFVGRLDDQVKIRGFRIEPDEIARAMERYEHITRAHVKVCDESTTKKLVAYFTCSDQTPNQDFIDSLKCYLKSCLPSYMIPSTFMLLPELPVNERGKIDPNRLPDAPQQSCSPRGTDDSAMSPTQRTVAKIWQRLFGADSISQDSHFFRLGGDSLLALKMVLLVEQELNRSIPVATLLPCPTLGEFVAFIDQQSDSHHIAEEDAQHKLPLTVIEQQEQPDQSLSQLVLVHAAGGGGLFYFDLYNALSAKRPAIIVESPHLNGDGPIQIQERNLGEIAERYAHELKDRLNKSIILVGYSLGGLLAHQMGCILSRLGVEVEKVINIDAPNPAKLELQSGGARFVRNVKKMKQPARYLRELVHYQNQARQFWKIAASQKNGMALQDEQRPLALEKRYVDMLVDFVPDFFDGTVNLIRSSEEPSRFKVPADYGWSDHASELNVSMVRGSHLTIFAQPYLADLQTAFRQAIEG